MKILIVGATGTLGRQVARHAIDAGYEVRCLVRSSRRAAFLKEWGAELVRGDLCYPETLEAAMDGVKAVIDASTSRPTDSLSIKQVDWDGKVALIKAAAAADIERFIFFSILNNQDYPEVPLMEIKRCTELFLAESGLNYTVLQLAGFMQGLIGQYGIPILEAQPVWVTGDSSPIAYMDTQDIAKFAIKALNREETENKTFPVVGTRAWSAQEIISLCERLSGKIARITRMPLGLLRTIRNMLRFFQWGWNVSDRLSFTEVLASGKALDASMDETYKAFDIDKSEITTLE
ncbi:MAG: NmrA family NAD(P)-binding protein, partial [Cyanobacteria bacterium J06632_19]